MAVMVMNSYVLFEENPLLIMMVMESHPQTFDFLHKVPLPFKITSKMVMEICE